MDFTDNASVKIFFSQYVCIILERYFHTEESLKVRGLPVSGDEYRDRNFLNQTRHVYLNIRDMAELFEKGAVITLEDPHKSTEIYGIIEQHLKDWTHIIANQYHVSFPPLEDFEALENLMQGLEYSVKVLNEGKIPDSGVIKRLSRFQRRLSPVITSQQIAASVKFGRARYTAKIAEILSARGLL